MRRATQLSTLSISQCPFLSTLSLRRATSSPQRPSSPLPVFLSTLSLRRATVDDRVDPLTGEISIHALLAESDRRSGCTSRPTQRFLSTLSLRRATGTSTARSCRRCYFYPRSPCGERRGCRPEVCRRPYFYPRSPCGERRHPYRPSERGSNISIHALLAESDLGCRAGVVLCALISIHALLAESDNERAVVS